MNRVMSRCSTPPMFLGVDLGSEDKAHRYVAAIFPSSATF